MDYFKDNMKCLQKNKKSLYQAIENSKNNLMNNNSVMVKSIDTRSQDKALVVEREGKKCRLNSSYYPLEEASCWAEQYNFDSIQLIIAMFGLGNGLFAREILRNYGSDFSFIIYEPSKEVFLHAIENYDLTDLMENPRIDIIIDGVNDLEFEEALRRFVDWSNINSLHLIYHPHYEKIFLDQCNYFNEKIKSYRTTQVVNQNTAAFLGKVITQNSIYNMKHLPSSNISTDFYNVFPKNLPAIIVGAGPSLDKNIEELKRVKGKAVIFATDTSLKYLFAHNIFPEFIVTLDAKKSMHHFMDERCKNINLLCSIESNTQLLDSHPNKLIFFNVGRYMEKFYKDMNIDILDYSSGGSVSTACFSLCANLGFTKIILIGQDLAYQGDVTHAGGVIVNANHSGEKTLMVMGNDGTMVRSRYDWYTYILWFNHAVAVCKEEGIEVINATEGGAKIDGVKLMTLSDAVEEYCNNEEDIDGIINTIDQKPNREIKENFIEFINKGITDCDFIYEKSVEAINICNKLIRKVKLNQINNKENQALVNKISKLNNEIQEKAVYDLIDDYILDITTFQLGELNSISKTEEDNQINVYQRSIVIYTGVRDASKEVKQQLENVINNLE